MKIFGCFMFFNELELLELRLMELYDTVDHFVLVEANKTHTGKEKPYLFEEHKTAFQPYLDKIIHVKVDDLPSYSPDNIWIAENFHRNCIMRGLSEHAVDGDKIIISDVDELPRIETIKNSVTVTNWIICRQKLFYYYVNCQQNSVWTGSMIANYGTFDTPQQLRDVCKSWRHRRSARQMGKNYEYHPIEHGGSKEVQPFESGWHYSFMGGADRIKLKIENICEGPSIANAVGSVSDIQQKIRTQQDLWGRRNLAFQKHIVDITNDQPRMLEAFLKKYPHFFYTPDTIHE